MIRALVLLATAVMVADSADLRTAAATASALQNAGLDPEQCYRVRDIAFQKDELKVYLTEGHLIFARPVQGRRFGAIFTADGPGGDAELLLLPPHRSERQSLATFAKTPNLNEHFLSAVFLFSDGTDEELLQQIASAPSVRKEPEAGLLLQRNFESVLKNITASYELRLVRDLLSAQSPERGFFYAVLNGRTLGNIDILFDPRAREQILAGQVVYRDQRQFFDVWTSFVTRSFRNGRRQQVRETLNIANINVRAEIQPDLHLKAVTKLEFTPNAATGRTISFELSRRMKVTEGKLDGAPVEIFVRDSLRANLLRGGDDDVFLAVMPEGLEAGRTYTLEITHEGDVISKSGTGVYFVGSRGSWYPNRGGGFSTYDLTFRYPKNLNLVATGDVVDDKEDGEYRVTRRKTSSPVRFAGFNLGEYEGVKISRAGISIEVYANRHLEDSLQLKPRDVVIVPQTPIRGGGRRQQEVIPVPMPGAVASPTARLGQLADEIGSAVEFMTAHFGPPPIKTLTVSPIPGGFGQGFPGLIYLSTLSYLSAVDRPVRTPIQQTFFSELLHAHETAHQWWGNLVTSLSHQDDWIMEALANYSAMMLLERKKGRRALEDILDEYREHLLAKDPEGRTIDSGGPIVWGLRLVSSRSPAAWRTITYEKGSWILHMLRIRLGDAQFLKMMGELVRRKRFQPLDTEEFRLILSEFLPAKSEDPKLEGFFEQWVYGSGIPTLKLSFATTGKAPQVRVKGMVTQSDVDENFTVLVPVEIQMPGKRGITHWVRTSSEPVPFSIDVKAPPVKVQLDPARAVLSRH